MANEDQRAEFGLDLDGDDLVAAAESAAQALEKLRGSIDEDVQALSGMQRAMKNIQGGGKQFDEQVKRLKLDIDAKKKAIATSQTSYVQLGGSFVKTAKTGRSFEDRIKAITGSAHGLGGGLGKTGVDAAAFESRLAAVTKQAQLMPGPLGGMMAKLGQMRGLVTGSIGVVTALVVALAALVGVIALAVAALFRYGVAQANARRSELLRLEGLTKLRFWFQRIPGDAKQMQGSIDRIAASSSLGRDKLVGYNEELYRMGLRGQNLTDALDAFQIKVATQGEAAARYWAGWAAGAALTGGSVKKLADRVRSQLGGIAQKQLESTEAQALKLKESFDALFNDLKMDEYLHQWRLVNDQLGQSTQTGRSLKQIMNTILQPLIDAAVDALPYLKRFFQGVVIETQRLIIAVLRVRLWWKKTFGGDDGTKGIDKMRIAVALGCTVVLALALGFAFLAGMVIAATWPFLLAAAAIWAIISTARLLYQLWDEIDWSGMGTAIWEGIVSGLKAGVNAITSVAEGIANDVTKAFKDALGISSPSKVFAALGIEIPEGIAVGINRGQPLAETAVANVVPREIPAPVVAASSTPNIPRATPDDAPHGDAPAAAVARAAAPSITIGDIVINTDAKDAPGLAADFKREIERVLEGIALQLGAPVAGET